MAVILILVNIDICQYHGCMKRQTDPDVRLLQAAADPTRLAIIRQLSEWDSVCACDLSSCCDVGQPTLSHHLRVLREAGWVRSERRGSWVYYWLEPGATERFKAIAGELTAGIGPPTSAIASGPRRLPVIQPSA
jgi:ArsR family transcriptional regulator, arsenate/arsenite/antimonite-responsive transcriptional repressor